MGIVSKYRNLTAEQIDYLNGSGVSRLATADADGVPHVVPVCHIATADAVYVTNGPTRKGRIAKRGRNVLENPRAALVVDHYDEDWTAIGYVLVQGSAELLEEGEEHDKGVRLLKQRYYQMREWPVEAWGLIALRVQRVITYGGTTGATPGDT